RHTRSKRDWSSDVCSSDLVTSAVRFLCKGRTVEFVQVVPKVSIKSFQAEVVHFLHVMEDTFFQDAHGILHRALVSGLSHLGRERSEERRVGIECRWGGRSC